MAQIAKIKAFFDPISGKFDQKTYLGELQQNGLTPAIFEKSLRDELAYNHFASGAAAGLRAPRLYGALVGAYGYEVHNLSLFALNPKILGPEPVPTDAELLKLMQDNAAALTGPETRALTVVRFSAQAMAPSVTADPAEVKKRFDFRKDTLSSQEARTLVQISVKTPEQAADVSAKLMKGFDPHRRRQGRRNRSPDLHQRRQGFGRRSQGGRRRLRPGRRRRVGADQRPAGLGRGQGDQGHPRAHGQLR
ncbi:MAG: SurA N-terminal domain-containing protein [Caulobacteraceae bacterium]